VQFENHYNNIIDDINMLVDADCVPTEETGDVDMSVGLSDLTYGLLADENDNYLIDNVVFTNTNYVPTEE